MSIDGSFLEGACWNYIDTKDIYLYAVDFTTTVEQWYLLATRANGRSTRGHCAFDQMFEREAKSSVDRAASFVLLEWWIEMEDEPSDTMINQFPSRLRVRPVLCDDQRMAHLEFPR
jgi:hypothetical protein